MKNNKTITIEEAKLMVGTEFKYYYSCGDSILAFVKKFDPKVGLTCETLETKTERDGWANPKTNEDGTWCVIGIDLNDDRNNIYHALKRLSEIKNTGKYVVKCRIGGGSPSCSFMG